MADTTTIKYVSLDNLTKYDSKIKEYIETKDDALQSNLEGQVTVVANALDGEITRAKAAEATNAAAAQAAQTAADTAQSEVDALELLVGTLPTGTDATTVVDYVNKKTAGIATDAALSELQGEVETIKDDYLTSSDKTSLQGSIDEVADDVADIVADYLKSDDKTELEGKIDAKADQTALDEVSGVANAAATQVALTEEVNRAKGEEARIEGLVTAEAERAAGVESGLEDRIETMEAFWAAAQADGTDSNVIDTLKEIQDYISSDETGASEMLAAIEANEKAIEDMDTAYKAADTAIKGRLDTLEAIDHNAYVGADSALKSELEGKINLKADTTALEDAVEGLEAVDTGLDNRITALETAVGDGGSVDGMISDAIDTEASRVDEELAKKVDKVDGYGLSENDLSDTLKANYDAAYEHSQVAHAPANAQANVIESIKVNGTAQTITDKVVDITVPTDNTELTNGAGYLVASDIVNKADKATTLAGYGITDAYTSTETDTAIANAIGQFEECTTAEIEALFA